jgi:predicted small lipoprotein YifL
LETRGGHNVAAALRCARVSAVSRGFWVSGEFALVRFGSRRFGSRLVIAAAGMAVLALTGCGRNGPLELPPGPATLAPTASTQLTTPDGKPIPGSQQDTAMKTGFDSQGRPVAAQGEKKSFILDPLLQ